MAVDAEEAQIGQAIVAAEAFFAHMVNVRLAAGNYSAAKPAGA
jgi:hypothetical protein